MNTKILTSVLTILAAPLSAQTDIQLGCYERIYGKAHLAQNPQQGVAALRMRIARDPDGPYVFTNIAATMADQGQGRRDGVGGQVLEVSMFCQGLTCFADGDAGRIEITRQSKDGLTFHGSAMLGDWEIDELPSSDLSEGTGERTVYRLNKVSDAVCEGLG